MKDRFKQNERGVVLLVVLMVVALLVTILVEFSFSNLVDLRLAETYRDSTRAYYLAKGGIKVGRTILKEDNRTYDGFDELWAQGIDGYPVADGTVSIHVDDLDGKLNLNLLIDPAFSTEFGRRYVDLLNLLGIPEAEALKDTLVDWLDVNDETQLSGAENTYYRSQQNPYNCKNAPLDSLEELLLVRGYNQNILQTLTPFVSVQGNEKLNINTAKAETIQIWEKDTPPNAGEILVEFRQGNPFTNVTQINQISGLETLLNLNFSVTSNVFRIESTAFVNDGRRTIDVVLDRSRDKILYKRVL